MQTVETTTSSPNSTNAVLVAVKNGSKVRYIPTGEIGVIWNIINEQYVQVDFGKGKFTNGRTLISNLEVV